MTAKTKALTLTTKPTAITTPQAVDWKRAAEDWLANLGSDRTRRAYREAWKAFIEFAQVAPDAVTQSQVIQYKTHLETAPSPKTLKPVCQATINLQLSALSSFFDFAKGRGLRADNPADGVGRKSITPYGKATWLDPDKGEDLKLLKAVDASTPQGLRDRALLLIFLTLALRVKSVADLRVGDLRRQGDAVFMKITAKGNKTREVKLPAITAAALAAWLKTRGELAPAAPVFTATAQGREAARRMLSAKGFTLGEAEETLSPRAIAYLLKTYCDRAFGAGHGIHPHSLRHTAAKIAESEGARLTEISDLLGHASLQVTTIYMHATDKAGDRVAATLGRRYAQAEGA